MDYHGLPRKQLQALCKKHSIPANSTNVSMADALADLFNVGENTKLSGHEGFQKQEVLSDDMSGSVLTDTFNTPRTNTRGKRHGPEVQDDNAEKLGLSLSALKPNVKSVGTAFGRRRRVEAMIESEIIGDSKVKTRTRGRPKNTISEATISKEEIFHSSEVEEASDAVAVQTSSVKAKRDRPRRVVRGILSSKKTNRRTDSEEENNQASDEKEEPVETYDESVEVVPEAIVKVLERPRYLQSERQPRKKYGQVEEKKPIAESIRVEEDASSMAEVTPAFKRSTRAKAAKVVDGCPVGTRSSARKKAGNVDSVKKMPGSSSIMSPATKTRRTKMASMMIDVSDNENEDFPVEKARKVSSKKKSIAKTPVCARRMLRSCPQYSEESIIEDVLEESVGKAQETSTRQVQNPVENRQQVVEFKKHEPSSEREDSDVRQDAVSSRETMKIATENRSSVAHTCIEEYQVLAADIKIEQVKEVREEVHADAESREKIASEEANGGVKSLIQTQNVPGSCKQDYREPAVHLFEESTCKVKQRRTRRGQNPVQNTHEAVDSEGQRSSGLITTNTTGKRRGMMPSRCKEECQVVATDLKAEPVKGVDKDELSVYREAVEHFKSVEIDGGILVQEPKLCEEFDEKTRLQDISEAAGTEQVESKNMVKVTGKKNHRSCVCQSLLKEICHSGKVDGQNVFQVEGSIRCHVQDICLHEEEPYNAMSSVCPYVAATHARSPVEGEFCSLLTMVNSRMVEGKESCFLQHQTVCMAEEGSCAEEMGSDTCTSKIGAEDLESSTLNNGKSQETEDKDGVGNSGGGIQDFSFWDQQTVCMPGQKTRARKMAKDLEDLKASVGISGGSCIQEKADPMHVEFNAEADVAFPNVINSRNVNEVKGILVSHDKRSKDLEMQQLDTCWQFSFLAGKVTANPVSGRTEFLDIDVTQNVSEAQHMNFSEEEYLDSETVSSNDFNCLGDQHMPRNPVDEINDNAVEANLQVIYNRAFLIDGVRETISSDLDNTEEEDGQGVQESKDCVHGAQTTSKSLQQRVTDLATLESQELDASKEFDSTEENLYTVTVCSNDFKEQTGLQRDSMCLFGETNASTIKEKLEVSCTGLLGVGKIDELSTGVSAAKKDQDALDCAVEGQHAWLNCSFSTSGGVTDRSTDCEGAGLAVILTSFPAQASDETCIEKLCCVLDAKVDQSQGSMVEGIVQGSQSFFEPDIPKSSLTEELIDCKLEDSIVVSRLSSRNDVEDFKDHLFVGELQGFICPFEDGKMDASGRVFCSKDDSNSVQKQHVIATQNCGSWKATEEGRHTSGQVSDDQTSIADPGTPKMEDVGPVSLSVANIELLKLKATTTIETSIAQNQIEDQIEAQGIEHAILELEFAVETNDDKNSSMVEDTGFLGNPVQKCEMDNTESSLAHPWKALCLGEYHLEQAGCKLQVRTQEKICASSASVLGAPVSINDQRLGIPNSSFKGSGPLQDKDHDLNDLSLRKLRALLKAKKVRTKEAEKLRKRVALQELSSNAREDRIRERMY